MYRERNWEKEQPAGSSVPGQTGKGVEVVNNKLIRNGSKIAMDERPDGQGPGKEKKKSQSLSSELWAPSIMWGLTSYQQSEQELHLINQSWQLLLGPISSTAIPLPLPQLPLSFTFCRYLLHHRPPSKGFASAGSVIPLVVSGNMHSEPVAVTVRGLQVWDQKGCWVMWPLRLCKSLRGNLLLLKKQENCKRLLESFSFVSEGRIK